MITYLPIAGGHIKLAERFVDPAFSFAMGWNLWYNWTVMCYFPKIFAFLNVVPVKAYITRYGLRILSHNILFIIAKPSYRQRLQLSIIGILA
jgi:amino acid permease